MKSGQKVRAQKGKDKPVRKGGLRALVAHVSFAPLVGLWGAALGGLVVMVMPSALIEEATRHTLIATYSTPAQTITACGAAVVFGVLLFAIAALKSAEARRKMGRTLVNVVAQRMRPIDPVRDLGTKSLDDPLETMPFATPAWRDADIAEPDFAVEPEFARAAAPETEPEPSPIFERTPEPEPEPQPLPRFMRQPLPDPEPETAPIAEAGSSVADPLVSVPQELDLAQFADLPGRNAVWIEEPAEAAPIAAPVAVTPVAVETPVAAKRRQAAPPPPLPGTAALARLRAMPPSELSIVEMVERFAGALHEHRNSAPVRKLTASELAAREAALAEAVRALAALSAASTPAAPADADEPLRSALSQLHPRRGVARA